MSEEAFFVRTGGGRQSVTRTSLLRFLDSAGPLGTDYIGHHMNEGMVNYDDFVAACRHFGLGHRLMDIGRKEVASEIAARRSRGAKARKLTRDRELMMSDVSPEEAYARLDIYERRVAEAEAKSKLSKQSGATELAPRRLPRALADIILDTRSVPYLERQAPNIGSLVDPIKQEGTSGALVPASGTS